MATPTQTKPRSMARVRPYKESDLAKLQELFHKNYPDLATPEFTNQDQLDLVLEDERGSGEDGHYGQLHGDRFSPARPIHLLLAGRV